MSLGADVAYAFRTIARNRLTSGAVILTLALGIGINTAVFSIVYGILLRPLPYAAPEQLMQVWLSNPRQDIERDITSYPNFRDWRERSRTFDALAGVSGRRVTLLGRTGAEEVTGAEVTEDYFRVLGVAPLHGRLLRPEDHMAGTAPVTVLSHELWMSRFGGGPVIGSTLETDGATYEIVGVLPEGIGDARLYMPLEQNPARQELLEARGALFLPVLGRLRDGVSVEDAQREMSAIAAQLEAEYPQANDGMGIYIEPLRDSVVGDTRAVLILLLSAVGVVLLIACANVANVLLARSTARRREMAVRVALGAGRLRLLRQVMTESLVLAFVGALAGIGVAAWTLDLLMAAAPADLPRADEIRLDGVALAFTGTVAVVAGLLFGAAPAWQVARREPGGVLGGSVRGDVGARDRLRSALVVSQYALALVLVAGAALLVRSFAELQRVDIGLQTGGVVSFTLSPSPQRYEGATGVQSFYDEVLPAIEAVPGVHSASLVN
ncbi:MAG TPA: ABC transporter permease, partial [Longimicrobiales bacterium]|nr:ABC transporter permease [Longimicrobiales bacterium]